jgi:iron complex transport system substrate-binding protein
VIHYRERRKHGPAEHISDESARKVVLLRIVSLLASATEIVAELGALEHLVGRSHECDYPSAVLALPVVSTVVINTAVSSAQIDAQIKHLASTSLPPANAALRALSIYALDVALLQSLRPDVIFTQTQCEVCAVSERDVVQAVTQLTGLQPQIVALSPQRLPDVWEDVRRVGEALERLERAQELVRGYQQRLDQLAVRCRALSAAFRPRVAVLEWLDPLMGAGNWTPELVMSAGGEPLFGEVDQHTPWLSWEELQAADPDVVILAPCGFSLARTLQDVPLLQRHPLWATLRAVKEGRVYAIDGNAYLNRSGPRLVESAGLLACALWGSMGDEPVDLTAICQIE